MISSNIHLLHELIDKSNVSIVDSNGKIDWGRLKDLQENNDGLDALELAHAAWDGLQTLYDVYDFIKGLVEDQPKLPSKISDPLLDAPSRPTTIVLQIYTLIGLS